MQKLIINNTVADLPRNQTVALTKRIVNWEKLESHSANYSNTLTLPYSKINNQIFQSAFDPASDSIDFRSFYEIQYIQDYNEVISYGRGKLIAADRDGYKFAMYWGNINLKEALEGKSIQELDLADLNHVWNLANVLDWYVVFGELSYPVVDLSIRGQNLLQEGTQFFPIKAYQLIPFVSADRIMNQIATDNGLVFEGIGGDEQIPVASKKLNPVSVFDIGVAAPKEVYSSFVPVVVGFTVDFNLLFDKVNADALGSFDESQNIIDGSMYTNTAASAQQLRFSLFLSLVIQTSVDDFKQLINPVLYWERWDGVSWVLESTIDFAPFSENFTANIFQLEVPEQEHTTQLAANERIRARYEFTFFSNSGQNLVVRMSDTSYFRTSTGDMSFGDTWQIAGNLPKINQFDFIKEICFLRGLVFDNKKDNVFEFTKIDDIINAAPQDLSDKFISLEVENIHTALAQSNSLKFNNDETVEKEQGSFDFPIKNNTLKQQSDYFTSKFGSSDFREWQSTRVMRLPILDPAELKWAKVNSRIARYSNRLDLYFTDDITTSQAPIWKTIAVNDGLNMENVWRRNYGGYASLLEKFKRVKMVLNLTQNDFESIDLKRPIYVKQATGKYLIEEVKSFVAGTPTELILLKL